MSPKTLPLCLLLADPLRLEGKAAGARSWTEGQWAGWEGEQLCPPLLLKRHIEPFLVVSSLSAGGGRFF